MIFLQLLLNTLGFSPRRHKKWAHYKFTPTAIKLRFAWFSYKIYQLAFIFLTFSFHVFVCKSFPLIDPVIHSFLSRSFISFSFIHSSFVRSFFSLSVLSFIPLFICSLAHSFIRSLPHTFKNPFVHWLSHWKISTHSNHFQRELFQNIDATLYKNIALKWREI